MDKAFLNNIKISAYDISLDYEMEKSVRKKSRDKKILCIDPNCTNPILKYCHGDKKQAYFAHLMNTDCDYDRFDKNDNENFKEIRTSLSRQFSKLGYKVETEVKLLGHHYSPLLCSKENSFFVIEMGDSKTTIDYVEKLLKEYSLKNIDVKWIVVGEEISLPKENRVSFLKRYLLNESKNNDFILVEKYEVVIQYRWNKKCIIDDKSKIYTKRGTINSLCVDDGELSIKGFNEEYIAWKNKNELVAQEKAKRLGKEHQNGTLKSKCEQILPKQKNDFDLKEKNDSLFYSNSSHSSNNMLENQFKTKKFRCTNCGKYAADEEFYMTQGDTGECKECHYGPEKYKKIKEQKDS